MGTLANILTREAPDDPGVSKLVRLFLIFRIRVLAGPAQVGRSAADVIGQVEVDDPRVRDALLKVLQQQMQWSALQSAVGALMQLPPDDLRMVEGVLVSCGKNNARRCAVRS